MHGRVKTISSEEQKEKQKKAREAKLQIFNAAMNRIISKREGNELDDEALRLTQEVLLSNPNINTLWNYRREVLLDIMTREDGDWDKISSSELSLTEQCLRSDPKSYCTWHHRLWVLDHLPAGSWQEELKLCNKMLAMDERNFHCWDYRKIVVDRAMIPPLEEYKFTTSKIETNFSNYSAWHFRSKLLTKLFPDPLGKYPVEESKHLEELELVQNAVFTDPDDQSAWFYQRWLLDLRSPPPAFVWGTFEASEITVALSQATCLAGNIKITVAGSTLPVPVVWQPLNGSKISSVWRCNLDPSDEDESIELSLLVNGTCSDTLLVKMGEYSTKAPRFTPENSEELKRAIEVQQKSFEELLELEPESKWTLLTSTLMMRSLNLTENAEKILFNLSKLIQVDHLRKGFYQDLISQIQMELHIVKAPFSSHCRLAHSNLHSLYHTQYLSLAQHVDLRGNKLKNNHLVHLYSLINCTELCLDDNEITSILKLPPLKKLVNLSLENNPLVNSDAEKAHLLTFYSLKNVLPSLI